MEKNRIAVIAGVIALILGIVIGSGMSGDGKKKAAATDVKELLNQAVQGVERLELEKSDLKAALELAKSDKAARENKSLKEELEKMRTEKADMQAHIQSLQEQVEDMNVQRKSVEDASARMEELEKQNKDLTAMLKQIQVITKGQKAEAPAGTPAPAEEKK